METCEIVRSISEGMYIVTILLIGFLFNLKYQYFTYLSKKSNKLILFHLKKNDILLSPSFEKQRLRVKRAFSTSDDSTL